MNSITTRAGRIAYTDQGDGPPIVMLHATLHDHHDYDAIVEPLARHHRVIAIDWPGHGESQSPPPALEVTAPLLAGVFDDLMTELDLGSVVIIGNSVGGFVAARFALDHPGLVAGLVLVNAAGFQKQSVVTRQFCRTLGRPSIARAVVPRLVPRYMRPISSLDGQITERATALARTKQGARTAAALWRSFSWPDYDLREHAAELRAPTLLVWGADDPVIPLEAGQQTNQMILGSTLVGMATGHVPFSSQPDVFLDHVEPFIAGAFGFPGAPVRTSPDETTG
ncbi:MAG TPA: alpha/beta hydrolase [Acidimicrobiales bacterium]